MSEENSIDRKKIEKLRDNVLKEYKFLEKKYYEEAISRWISDSSSSMDQYRVAYQDVGAILCEINDILGLGENDAGKS